jgi:hypothetical protein
MFRILASWRVRLVLRQADGVGADIGAAITNVRQESFNRQILPELGGKAYTGRGMLGKMNMMTHWFVSHRLGDRVSQSILEELSARQHLRPHLALKKVLAEMREQILFSPKAAQAAIEWLGLDESRAIGRLRRAELIQLARSIYRFERQLAADSGSRADRCKLGDLGQLEGRHRICMDVS